MKPAVFLDRDGTIIEDRNFITRTEDVHFLPGAVAALRALQRAGFLLFIVTNQSGVGRGLMEIADVERLHRFLAAQLAKQGVKLDGVYVCPHHPNDGCACRKPLPKHLLSAAEAHGVDLTRSYLVGDRLSDVETAQNAGCIPILVETGLGKEVASKHRDQLEGVFMAKDLASAVKKILALRVKVATS